MKFLIDECLSPSLVELAWEAGYVQSTHVCHRGMTSWKDHHIMRRILENDWTLVTNNAKDFRPESGSSSLRPCYVGISVHAGLVCLNTPFGSAVEEQIYFFESALEYLANLDDLINTILEVDSDIDLPGKIKFNLYDHPPD